MALAVSASKGRVRFTPWVKSRIFSLRPLRLPIAAYENETPERVGRATLPDIGPLKMRNLRRVPDAEVQKGEARAAKHGLPRLREILERLPPEQRPALVRGDSAFGNEGGMAALDKLPECWSQAPD
jgi:hypothetical protein